jgi:membrane protein DedA with SNARE-associated domain
MHLLQTEYAPEWIQSHLTSELGLVVLLGLCILEGAMMLRFMPSELVVPAALALIGTALPTVFAVVLIAVVGTTVGQALLFLIVRRGGREYVLQSRWVPIGEDKLDRFDAWFEKWGLFAVPASNTMLFVRGLLTFPAGLSDMRLRTFVTVSALGSLSFQTILAALYIFAEEVIVF